MANSDPGGGASAEFVRLLTGNQRKLYAFILSLLRRPADADDVLQETNMVMWRKCGEFAPGTNFDAWSFSIARYQVMAHRKRQERSRLHFDDELLAQLAERAAIEFAGEDDRHEALSHCLQKLPKNQRRMVAARYEPGSSVQHLAERDGRSAKAFSEALRRIRKALLQCVELRMAQGNSL